MPPSFKEKSVPCPRPMKGSTRKLLPFCLASLVSPLQLCQYWLRNLWCTPVSLGSVKGGREFCTGHALPVPPLLRRKLAFWFMLYRSKNGESECPWMDHYHRLWGSRTLRKGTERPLEPEDGARSSFIPYPAWLSHSSERFLHKICTRLWLSALPHVWLGKLPRGLSLPGGLWETTAVGKDVISSLV